MILLFSLWVLFDHNIKKETTVFLVGFSVPIIDGRGWGGTEGRGQDAGNTIFS